MGAVLVLARRVRRRLLFSGLCFVLGWVSLVGLGMVEIVGLVFWSVNCVSRCRLGSGSVGACGVWFGGVGCIVFLGRF